MMHSVVPKSCARCSLARMREPLSLYSGFVRSELTRMGFAESILGKIGAGAGNLRQAMNIPVEPSQNPGFLS